MKFFSPLLLVLASLLFSIVSAKGEDKTTSNLTPSISEFSRSGGTSVGQGWGCSSGQYCTSGTNEGGGTYTSTFDVPLTEAEVRQGFTLNSGITINSHSSNSRLASCTNGVLQSGDCRDMFKLTITLKDGATTVETFIHQEELDWTGIRNFTYSDTVASNSYGVLSGVLSLFGIDAGYPTGYYGPQFSNPSLTIDYQTALVTEDVTTLISDVIETETETTIMEVVTLQPEIVPVETTISTTIPILQTFSSVETPSAPPVSAPPVDSPTTTAPVTETTIEAPVVEPEAPAAPTIAPVVEPSETQQEQTNEAEAKIEAKVQQPKAKASLKTKVQGPTNSPAVNISVPVTPAVAAQSVVDNIAPSQKYGGTAQTVTLVAMGMIADNRQIFKGATIPDVPNFFSSSSVPDGPSIVDIANNYSFIGQSNGQHDALVESQWSK